MILTFVALLLFGQTEANLLGVYEKKCSKFDLVERIIIEDNVLKYSENSSVSNTKMEGKWTKRGKLIKAELFTIDSLGNKSNYSTEYNFEIVKGVLYNLGKVHSYGGQTKADDKDFFKCLNGGYFKVMD